MKAKFWIAILVVLGLVSVIVFGFTRAARVEVTVVPAYRGTAVNAVTGTVKVYAGMDINLKTEQRGRIEELFVEGGQIVEKGQLLVKQQSLELEIRLEQHRIRSQAAQARLNVTSPLLYEIEGMQSRISATELAVSLNQTSRSRLDEERLELSKVTSRHQLEQIDRRENADFLAAMVNQLENEASQMLIKAPFAGKVVEILAWPGDLLHANNNVLRLVSHGRFIQMTLSEEDFYGVAIGQQVTIRLASLPDQPLSGKVSGLSPVADADRKTRNLFVNVEAEDDLLVPGFTGEGYLVKDERPGTVLVPRRALIGNLVAVVKDGIVEMRRVQPGFTSLNLAEIISGLEPDEIVVLDNPMELRDGDKVRTRTR